MPGLNQKGPMGQGSMTGRRMGRCTNFGASLKSQPDPETHVENSSTAGDFPGRGQGMWRGKGGFMGLFGRGRGMGRGRGLGRQNRFRGGE